MLLEDAKATLASCIGESQWIRSIGYIDHGDGTGVFRVILAENVPPYIISRIPEEIDHIPVKKIRIREAHFYRARQRSLH